MQSPPGPRRVILQLVAEKVGLVRITFCSVWLNATPNTIVPSRHVMLTHLLPKLFCQVAVPRHAAKGRPHPYINAK
eukprot:5077219-Prymnesium_polylepis.2